jgi:hypothetical protein
VIMGGGRIPGSRSGPACERVGEQGTA